jgi:pilus assembly protein CpaE
VQLVLASEDQSATFLRAAMRAGAREVLPLPLDMAALDEALATLERKAVCARTGEERGKVFAFIGCKGGAGTTFLATNWAHALAAEPSRKVALLDLNRQFGDALFYLSDESPAMDLADLAREAKRLDGSMLTGSMVDVLPNLHLLAAADTPEKAQGVTVQEVTLLLEHAMREYHAVVLDLGNVVDDVSALAMDMANRVYPVLQATLPCLRAASRLHKVLKAYPADKVEWVVNRYEEQGEVQLPDIARALQHAQLRTICGSFRTVCASINQGIALSRLDRKDRVVRDLERWAAAVYPAAPRARQAGWFSRWRRRGRDTARTPAMQG